MIPPDQRKQVTNLALDSISHGLQYGSAIAVTADRWPQALQNKRSSFVTLHTRGDLRGCMGALKATQPLIVDVAQRAYAAAFRDPRFDPLQAAEFDELSVHVSILSPAEPVPCVDERDLLTRLHPGTDGLTIREGRHEATFLPSVWEQLPEPIEFLRQLKRKAGLASDYWSDRITVESYTTESW